MVFPCFNLESSEGLARAFEKRTAHSDPVPKEWRISTEVCDIDFFLGYVKLRRIHLAKMGSVASGEEMVAQHGHVPVGIFVGPMQGAGTVENGYGNCVGVFGMIRGDAAYRGNQSASNLIMLVFVEKANGGIVPRCGPPPKALYKPRPARVP